jgi:hypothetical protein
VGIATGCSRARFPCIAAVRPLSPVTGIMHFSFRFSYPWAGSRTQQLQTGGSYQAQKVGVPGQVGAVLHAPACCACDGRRERTLSIWHLSCEPETDEPGLTCAPLRRAQPVSSHAPTSACTPPRSLLRIAPRYTGCARGVTLFTCSDLCQHNACRWHNGRLLAWCAADYLLVGQLNTQAGFSRLRLAVRRRRWSLCMRATDIMTQHALQRLWLTSPASAQLNH